MKVCCGIVSYNPNIRLLKKNIIAVKDQVDTIFIVDNGSKNLEEEKKLVKSLDLNIKLIINSKNKGIAAALNQLLSTAYELSYSWILTLDQDSVCPPDLIRKLGKFRTISNNIGIITPIIFDRNVGVIGHKTSKAYKDVRTCITSGALTNVLAWEKVGGFDEKMFIDSVDLEYCYRLRKCGFRIIQVSSVRLNHSIGKARYCKFLFWKFKNTEHSAMRDFYIAQNNIYYPRKHHLIIRLVRGNYRNIKNILIILIYESNKKKKIHAVIRGWKQGFLM